jgi:hypothetical protein
MKNNINTEIENYCDEVEDLLSKYNVTDSKRTFNEMLKADLLNFVLYLSASDKIIKKEEAEFLSEYLSANFSEKEMYEIIMRKNIYSADFEEKVPYSLKIVAKIQAELNKNKQPSYITSLSERYILIFKNIGQEIIVCDHNIHENEIEDFEIYTNMMIEYIEENISVTLKK